MRKNKVISILKCLVIIVLVVRLGITVYLPVLPAEQANGIVVTQDDQGINITLSNRFELYFNGSNGGEVTRYFDLFVDPSRSTNLVLPSTQSQQQPGPYNLLPLFSSILYNPYVGEFRALGSTGGDGNATLTVLGNGTDYVIFQTTARIMDAAGGVFRDVNGNANYVNSIWLIRSDGYIFLERTLYTPKHAVIQDKYRWYPFYLVRTTGFNYSATFYLFNTTYAYTYNVSKGTYKDDYNTFPLFPADENGYFGIAVPFSNMSLGGDGTNNIVLVYDLVSPSGITEWKSDSLTNHEGLWGTEFGPVHEFDADYTITTHTFHAMIVLTHDPVTEQNGATFADHFNKNPVFPLVKPSLTVNRLFCELGEPFVVSVSATFDYNMVNMSKTLTLTDGIGRTLWHKNYGILNVSQGEIWSHVQLLNQTISAIITSGDYTFTFRLLSTQGIMVGSDSVNVIVTVKACQFGKAEVGQYNGTSYKDYKGVSRYLIPEDGWITSISMWFGNQGFEAKVAIYTHPKGKLVVQSQSEGIASLGWHNFTIPRTFLFGGFYGLAWKNSEDATVAYDLGLKNQTARSPESYYAPFSPTFDASELFDTETSIYATYDPVTTKVGVSIYPKTPSYDENVTVVANAKDGGILTEPILSYSTDTVNWFYVAMTSNEGVYTAKIPPHPYNTTVYYKVYVHNMTGGSIGSEIRSYQVADLRPPNVSYFKRTPMSPNYNETVSVFAGVSEPINASGVKLVILSYWNGSTWTNISMTLEDKLFMAVIPPMPYGTTVNYTILAFDYTQNVATLDIYSYTVADKYPPTARIDEPTSGSYLKGFREFHVVPVNVTGSDANFDKMELYIAGNLVQTWDQQGSETYYWDTTKYADGVYLVKLIVYDKAGNIAEKEIYVTIDNAMSGWSLALIASLTLMIAALVGTWIHLKNQTSPKERSRTQIQKS